MTFLFHKLTSSSTRHPKQVWHHKFSFDFQSCTLFSKRVLCVFLFQNSSCFSLFLIDTLVQRFQPISMVLALVLFTLAFCKRSMLSLLFSCANHVYQSVPLTVLSLKVPIPSVGVIGFVPISQFLIHHIPATALPYGNWFHILFSSIGCWILKTPTRASAYFESLWDLFINRGNHAFFFAIKSSPGKKNIL